MFMQSMKKNLEHQLIHLIGDVAEEKLHFEM